MAELNCSIEYDDTWEQVGCHWEVTKFFRLTWNIPSTDVVDKYLGYRVGTYSEDSLDYLYPEAGLIQQKNNTYTYELKLSDILPVNIDDIDNIRSEDGHISITAYANIRNTNGEYSTVYYTFNYYLELPPKHPINNIKIDYIRNNPGEFSCSWDPADIAKSEANELYGVDSVDGYCIELFHQPGGTGEFIPVAGLRLVPGETRDTPARTVYKLEKIPGYTAVTFTELPEDPEERKAKLEELLQGEVTFRHYGADTTLTEESIDNGITSEVYIELLAAAETGISIERPEFYFTPKQLNILPGDKYKFNIYPYLHPAGSEAHLSSHGSESEEKEVPKGIVRVKTANGWAEGQVWVMTESGWKNAEAIYTKTADGWKEAI